MTNIKNIIKIKENFLNFLSMKIEEVQRIINEPKKEKSRFNMTAKELLRRQVLVSMSLANSTKLIVQFTYIYI